MHDCGLDDSHGPGDVVSGQWDRLGRLAPFSSVHVGNLPQLVAVAVWDVQVGADVIGQARRGVGGSRRVRVGGWVVVLRVGVLLRVLVGGWLLRW